LEYKEKHAKMTGLDGFVGGEEGWRHSAAAVPVQGEAFEKRNYWARNKSSDVQLTGAHVPLTAEQIAELEGRQSAHAPVPLGKKAVEVEKKAQ